MKSTLEMSSLTKQGTYSGKLEDFLKNREQLPFLQLLSRRDLANVVVEEEAIRNLERTPQELLLYPTKRQVVKTNATAHDTSAIQMQSGSLSVILQLGTDENQYIILSNAINNPFLQDKNFTAAIHIAAERGLPRLIEYLVRLGENINRKDGFGRTPLHYAAIGGDIPTMRIVKKLGGDVCIQDAMGANALELLTGNNEEAIRLLVEPNPLEDIAVEANELQVLLSTCVVSKTQNITKIFYLANVSNMLTLTPDGRRLSAIGESRGLHNDHVKLLQFIENWFSIKVRLTIQLAKQCKGNVSHRMADPGYVDLFIELLRAINDIGYQNSQFYLDSMKKALNVLAAIGNAISWDLKKCFFDLVPWQNIESLFMFNQTEAVSLQDTYLKEYLERFVSQSIPALLKNFDLMRDAAERWYNDDTSDLPAEKIIDGIQDLYNLTNPFIDHDCLAKFLSLTEKITAIEPATVEGKTSIIALVKILGEFSKCTQLSRNLSFAVQKMFNNVPWHIFIELRNLISKSIETPSRVPAYLAITKENDDMFLRIQQALIGLHKEVVRVMGEFDENIKIPARIIELYSRNFPGIALSQEALMQLTQDLETAKNKKLMPIDAKILVLEANKGEETEGKSAKKQEKRLRDLNKQIGVLKQKQDRIIQEYCDILKLMKQYGINNDVKGKISQFFQGVDGIEDCQARWLISMTLTCPAAYQPLIILKDKLSVLAKDGIQVDYYYLSGMLINTLITCFVQPTSLCKMIASGLALYNSDSSRQKEVYGNFRLYQQNPNRFLQIEHTICDVHECLEKLHISTTANKILRNFLEHRNSIIMRSRSSDVLELNLFLKTFGLLLDARKALIPLLQEHYSEMRKFHQHGIFFSPSRYATEQQPYGPYSDHWCFQTDPDTTSTMQCTQLARLGMF